MRRCPSGESFRRRSTSYSVSESRCCRWRACSRASRTLACSDSSSLHRSRSRSLSDALAIWPHSLWQVIIAKVAFAYCVDTMHASAYPSRDLQLTTDGEARMQQESAQSLKTSFDARAWWLLALVCGVLFLDGLDVSMVGVALPSIGSELGLEPSSLQWVVSGYILGYGGLLLLGGRAADLLGRRRVLLGGLAVFLVASFIGGLANDGNTLIATRFIKGAAV